MTAALTGDDDNANGHNGVDYVHGTYSCSCRLRHGPTYPAPMSRIVVLNGPSRRLDRQKYFISLLAREWIGMGLAVEHTSNPQRLGDDAVAFVHVDLTTVPADFVDAARGAAASVNLQAVDISKRTVSERVLTSPHDYLGPVIVKTDANCGGLPERFGAYDRPGLGLLSRAWDRLAPWTWTRVFRYGHYPVYSRSLDVPGIAWRDPAFVVEPFTPERRGDEVVVRSWTFLGDREVNRMSVGMGPVLKRDTARTSTYDSHVPDEVRQARLRLGLDYGKIDYVIVDGVPLLLDANRTPTVASDPSEGVTEIARRLAPGIEPFLP